MKVIVVGNGTVGSAVQQALREHGHEVVDIGRTRGTYKADTTNIDELRALFPVLTPFDAVASAAGDLSLGPLAESSDAQWAASLEGKGMGQINLVRAALPHISDGGSFTLVSGIVGDECMVASSVGSTVDYMVEGFVKGAATELPRGLRINCVSPTVLAEAPPPIHAVFPGFTPVPPAEVAQPSFRPLSIPITGRILKVHNL